MSHDHDYMHEHDIPHSHGHTQPHAQDDGHAHGCAGAAGCDANCAACDIDPRVEIAALMKYMVGHNAAHAGELAQLAGRLRDMGDAMAYEQVMLAVSDFEKGNLRLSAVLAAMDAK